MTLNKYIQIKQNKFILLFGGSRSGKTFVLTAKVVARALKEPKSRHAIFRQHRKDLKESVWLDTFVKALELNFPNDPRHKAYAEDAFKFLDRMEKGAYDLIILDPPAFAKHKDALRNALKGYSRLNQKAFEKIASGGILFTFSCSQVVTKDNFRTAVFTAAAQARRKVRILHQLHQPADHPINIYHPEGEYLKGLVLYVE